MLHPVVRPLYPAEIRDAGKVGAGHRAGGQAEHGPSWAELAVGRQVRQEASGIGNGVDRQVSEHATTLATVGWILEISALILILLGVIAGIDVVGRTCPLRPVGRAGTAPDQS